MPLSLDNAWPQKVSNVSIFPYLARHKSVAKYKEFCRFITTYYKSSCAIVYYPPGENFSVMLGSGGLVSNYSTISTARHILEGLDPHRLYARFYDYQVAVSPENPDALIVDAQHIDINIKEITLAAGGLDACWLNLVEVSPALQKKYMYPLERYTPVLRGPQTLDSGRYTLFHFAGGQHLVSLGDIQHPPHGAAWLHSNIGIEAGPGASGAVPIQKNFDCVAGYGVSIHRAIRSYGGGIEPERRIIPFWYFDSGTEDFDKITTPYALGAPPLDEGYEFLSWTESGYALREREDKPAGPQYRCQEGHACHHVTPIRDLMYLWDYFVEGANTYHREDWQEFGGILKELCPFSLNRHGKLEEDRRAWNHAGTQSRKLFAWAWWNLFRGPKDRSDDPRWAGTQNEKVRPLKFPERLWNSVQSLFWRIQHLKALDQEARFKRTMRERLAVAEDQVLETLKEVRSSWAKTFLDQQPYTIVKRHDKAEWETTAKGKWKLKLS